MKAVREWTDAAGIRCVEVDDPSLAGETMVDGRDLAKFLSSLDPALIADPVKGSAVERFQRDVALLGPAVAHRRAVTLLESFGATVPDLIKSAHVRVVKAGGK